MSQADQPVRREPAAARPETAPAPGRQEAPPTLGDNHAALSRLLLQRTLDALPAAVAVLDEDQRVLLVNRAWRNFGESVGRPAGESHFVGWSYLDVCRRSATAGDATATAVVQQFERVARGEIDEFELTYDCPTPSATRWFSLRVATFEHHRERYAIVIHSDITQLKQAELRAVRSEERFARAIEASLQAIWEWDAATGAINYSPGVLTTFGFQPEQLRGGVETWLTFVVPEDVEKLVGAIAANMRGETDLFAVEYRIRRGDGTIAWVMTRGLCERDARGDVVRLLGTAIDLTEFKAAIDEIRRNEELLRSIVAAAPLGVVLLDAEGTILSLNPAASAALGYTGDEAIGTTFPQYLPEDIREGAEVVVRDLLGAQDKGSSFHGDLRVLHRNGTHRLLETTCVAVEGPGRTRLHAFLRDVTEERALLRLKDEMLSTLGHELRTPLTSIQGFAELMATGRVPAEQVQTNLEIILREARRMRALINDFLNLKRVESGRFQYKFEAVQLGEIVRTAVSSVAPTWWENHTARVDLPADLPPVRADAIALASVVDNLLSNALKFSPQGGEVSIVGHCVDGSVRLAIHDEGIGIPADEAPHVFESFFRSSTAREHEIGGTGLGLAIARAIVQAHQGRLWLTSSLGEGTTFFVELPPAVAADAASHLPHTNA